MIISGQPTNIWQNLLSLPLLISAELHAHITATFFLHISILHLLLMRLQCRVSLLPKPMNESIIGGESEWAFMCFRPLEDFDASHLSWMRMPETSQILAGYSIYQYHYFFGWLSITEVNSVFNRFQRRILQWRLLWTVTFRRTAATHAALALGSTKIDSSPCHWWSKPPVQSSGWIR